MIIKRQVLEKDATSRPCQWNATLSLLLLGSLLAQITTYAMQQFYPHQMSFILLYSELPKIFGICGNWNLSISYGDRSPKNVFSARKILLIRFIQSRLCLITKLVKLRHEITILFHSLASYFSFYFTQHSAKTFNNWLLKQNYYKKLDGI